MINEFSFLQSLVNGLSEELPEHPGYDLSIPHAPKRNPNLSIEEKKLAI
jgi:hypothetical protein